MKNRPDGSVWILDPATDKPRQTIHPLGADETVSLAFAPNGTLATGTCNTGLTCANVQGMGIECIML